MCCEQCGHYFKCEDVEQEHAYCCSLCEDQQGCGGESIPGYHMINGNGEDYDDDIYDSDDDDDDYGADDDYDYDDDDDDDDYDYDDDGDGDGDGDYGDEEEDF